MMKGNDFMNKIKNFIQDTSIGKLIFFSQFIAYVILFMNKDDGGEHMETGLWAVAVAVIGLVGSTWYQYIASKKDIKPLSGIQATTSEMKPRIENIDENTKKSRDVLIEDVKPEIFNIQRKQSDINDQMKKIDYVVKEFEYQTRLKEKYSTGFNKEVLTAGIDSIYERNAILERTLHEKEQTISEMTVSLRKLKEENEELHEQIIQYEMDYQRRNHDQGLSR